MKKTIALASLLFAGYSQAAIVSFGNVEQETDDSYIIYSSLGKSDKKIENRLDLAQGTLDSAIGANARNGSVIYDTVSINTGDTFSFDWNWQTNEFFGSEKHNDFAFASLSLDGITILADTFTPSPSEGTFSWTATTSGLLKYGIGVMNVKDKVVASQLSVSDINVATAEVPLPASALLLLSGLFGTRALRKKKARA